MWLCSNLIGDLTVNSVGLLFFYCIPIMYGRDHPYSISIASNISILKQYISSPDEERDEIDDFLSEMQLFVSELDDEDDEKNESIRLARSV
jgi:hypothetical protein